MNLFLIALGGFIGANARYIIGLLAKKYIYGSIPMGTLLINVVGSFLLGVLLGKGVSGNAYAFFGVGFMGAFTTFSTFKLELVQLWQSQEKKAFLWYFILSYIFGIGLATIGYLFS